MISVIIPTWNAERTIELAVESVLKQTFEDFEVIICDDCSTDDTWNILKKMSNMDQRIKIFKNDKNSKSAFTRNLAIKMAKGEYIMQLDDDDYCTRDRMERQYNFLRSNPEYGFVGSSVYVFDRNGIYSDITPIEKPVKKDFVKTSPFLNPSVMFRKEVLEKVKGYRVSSETERGQDYDLFMRLYIAGFKGYNLQEKLVYYYNDKNYFSKIKFKNRVGEFKFRYRNFKELGLLPENIFYVFKPIIAACIPNTVLQWNRKKVISK